MNICEHPIHKLVYDLMVELDKLPASPQATKACIMASAIQVKLKAFREEISCDIKCLRQQSYDFFPEIDGKKHFARIVMESCADSLDECVNPKKGHSPKIENDNPMTEDSREK